jgi:hypothetical protein
VLWQTKMKCCLCGRAGGVRRWLPVPPHRGGASPLTSTSNTWRLHHNRYACSKECWDVEYAAELLRTDGGEADPDRFAMEMAQMIKGMGK